MDTKKRIIFIKSFASERVSFRKGKEYEVPDVEADQYVNAGLANVVNPSIRKAKAKPQL